MDDIIALLAREAGKKFEEAQKAAVVEAARRNAAIVAAKRQAARGPASAGKTAAPASAPAPVVQAAPVPAPSPPVAPPVAPLVPDGLVLPEFAPPPHPSLALLAALAGGTSLLSGIVLSEALAPPISLRKGQLFDRLQR